MPLTASPSPSREEPLREWLSRFVSGLEHFWDALQYNQHDPRTRRRIVILAVHCLVIQAIVDFFFSLRPENICTTFNQLIYPCLLLYRYLHPDPWDDLFTATVRALGGAERSDIIAKPRPQYFTQLAQFLRRSAKACLALGIVHQLVNRTQGFLVPPSLLLGLGLVLQYLRHKGISFPLVKLLVVITFMGPRWPIWLTQKIILQQLFVYELLQPYLARVQFKSWEERAWWAEHETELMGFGLGVWAICSLPWVGPAAVPLMFPAVSFLLTRSCGSLENQGHNKAGGDVIERRSPGVKLVAMGMNPAVGNDWDTVSVTTFVKDGDRAQGRGYISTSQQHVREGKGHLSTTTSPHYYQDVAGGPVSMEQL
ncbi:hypothetical protein BGW38_005301, partial [Lunasporangiospora selenospora]